MVRKSKTADLVLPGKSYFLKNPDGFIFTYIFSSGAAQDALTSILGKDISITPVSIQISPMKSLHSFGKCLIATATFPQEFPGKALSVMPYAHIKKLIANSEIDYSGLMNTIHAPVEANLSRIIEKKISGISVSSIYANAGKFPADANGNCLWIKFHWEIQGKSEFFSLQCISLDLLSSIYRHFLGEDLAAESANDPEKLLSHIRDLNKRFQDWLFASISLESSGNIALKSTTPDGEEPFSINLEELRLVDDRAIRTVIEETTRKHLPLKTLIGALAGMSDELRNRFLHNMSRNRRADIRDGFKRIQNDAEEVVEAQRDLAWIILELVENEEIKINKRLKTKLSAIVEAMNRVLRKSAEDYVRSNRFGESISVVNNVMLQLLLRRVPRKILVPALSEIDDETLQKIKENMTPFSIDLLNEDLDYWKQSTQDKTQKITTVASSQKTMIRTAIKLKQEFARAVI